MLALLILLQCGGGAFADHAADEAEADPASEERRGVVSAGEAPGGRWKTGARHVREDLTYLLTFTKRTNPRGAVATTAVGLGIAALALLDDEIREGVQENRSESLDRWEERVEPLGNGAVTSLAALATYGIGRALDDEETTETGRALVESLLLVEVIGKASKGLFGRAPPRGGNRASDFFDGGSAFPSGHTWRAFTIAAVLGERHGRTAAWVGYPLATLVGLSRIESDAHWASDVLAGAALGHVVGRAIVRKRSERRGRPARTRLAPYVDRTRRALGLSIRIPVGRAVTGPEPADASAFRPHNPWRPGGSPRSGAASEDIGRGRYSAPSSDAS